MSYSERSEFSDVFTQTSTELSSADLETEGKAVEELGGSYSDWEEVWTTLKELKVMESGEDKGSCSSKTSIKAVKRGPRGQRPPVVPYENELKSHNWTEAKERGRGIRRCFRKCGMEFQTEAEEQNHYRKCEEECTAYDNSFVLKQRQGRALFDPGALPNPLSRKGKRGMMNYIKNLYKKKETEEEELESAEALEKDRAYLGCVR